MKERPILFSSQMVRALLDGSKTQTRRVLKGTALDWISTPIDFDPQFIADAENHLCPYGQPGDKLWVREAWSEPTSLDPGPTFYRADYPACVPPQFSNVPPIAAIKWKPSIHMRRDQSRIMLEITGVRVERLQDISRGDAMAEGCPFPNMADGDDPRKWYADLWQKINGPGSWDANPLVWVVEFMRVESQK